MRQIHIFFKISNARQCLFPLFVRFVNWTPKVKLFLLWFSRWYNTGVISGSQMGSQLLQNMKIIKQIDVLLWKIWRKYGSVSYLFGYLFGCTNATHSTLIPPALGKKTFHRILHKSLSSRKEEKISNNGARASMKFCVPTILCFPTNFSL